MRVRHNFAIIMFPSYLTFSADDFDLIQVTESPGLVDLATNFFGTARAKKYLIEVQQSTRLR
jgi:hypothetical protein